LYTKIFGAVAAKFFPRNLSKRVKEIFRGFDIIRIVRRANKVSKERFIMKNDKFFDGDKIYAIGLTIFTGVCSVGLILAAALQNFF